MPLRQCWPGNKAGAVRTDPAGEAQATGALMALLAGAVGIAFAPILVRLADTGPIAAAFWRIFLALPAFLLWRQLRSRQPRRPLPRQTVWLAILAGLAFAADLAVWHISIHLTSVANATFLANLAPVAVVFGAWALLGERPRPIFFGGLAAGLVGAGLLVRASLPAGGDALLGDALGILTALFYATYQLAVKRARDSADTLTIMLISGTACAAALGPAAWLAGETLLPSSAAGWAVACLLALVCQFGGQATIAFAAAHLPASFASVALLLQPVTAAGLAWLLFGEALGVSQWLGAALILGGILLAKRGTQTTRPARP